MRRSFREAAVGLSVLAALAIAVGLWLRLRGHRFASAAWPVAVHLDDAAGLVSRSTVYYRGVDVGMVRSVTPEPGFVVVQAEISDPALAIPQPVTAQVGSGSVLGGTAQLVLTGSSNPLPAPASPTADDCSSARQLCAGDVLQGTRSPTLGDVTASAAALLDQAVVLDLLGALDQAAEGLIQASNSFTTAADNTSVLMESLQDLAQQLSPSVNQINTAAVNLNTMTSHLANAAAELDRPETIAQFRQVMANVASATDQLNTKAGVILANVEGFTANLDRIGSDIVGITSDPAVANGLRNMTVGLGLLFEELYGPERLADPESEEEIPQP
ncbi:MlaD family protein [Candidatus Synechococcus spongiarum]|uniref:MlaD family protein n=1 Tax=Candidatus Synechococcus spongiarum TaxID=431041 RepID=UPI000471E567|nr:MlaD family protein [Candidatus Synechococcus spongiarum]